MYRLLGILLITVLVFANLIFYYFYRQSKNPTDPEISVAHESTDTEALIESAISDFIADHDSHVPDSLDQLSETYLSASEMEKISKTDFIYEKLSPTSYVLHRKTP